jgi:hypothetical protein
MKEKIHIEDVKVIDFWAERAFGYYEEGELAYGGKIEIVFSSRDDLKKYITKSEKLKKKKLAWDIQTNKIHINWPHGKKPKQQKK